MQSLAVQHPRMARGSMRRSTLWTNPACVPRPLAARRLRIGSCCSSPASRRRPSSLRGWASETSERKMLAALAYLTIRIVLSAVRRGPSHTMHSRSIQTLDRPMLVTLCRVMGIPPLLLLPAPPLSACRSQTGPNELVRRTSRRRHLGPLWHHPEAHLFGIASGVVEFWRMRYARAARATCAQHQSVDAQSPCVPAVLSDATHAERV